MTYKLFGTLTIPASNLPDATTGTKGVVQLTGDFGGTATSPSVLKLNSRPINSVAPNDGYILTWSQSDGYWLPRPISLPTTVNFYKTLTPPTASNWTIFNSIDNVSVVNDSSGGLLFSRDGNVATDYLTGAYVSIAHANTFTVGAGMSEAITFAGGSQVNGGGIFISDGTKFIELYVGTASGVRYIASARWNSATSLNTVLTLTDTPNATWIEDSTRGRPFYIYWTGDGTNIYAKVGFTGRAQDAFTIYSEAVGAFLGTITQCGVYLRGNNGGGSAVPTRIWVPSWQNSTP